jgi:multisubunit Na+/H+ antiporter MnhF subunit
MLLQDFVDLVSVVRIKFGNRPFWVFVAAFLTISVLQTLVRVWGKPERDATTRRTAATPVIPVGLSIAAIAAYVAVALWYLIEPKYHDYAEPTVAAVGWLFHVGRPIYHAFDSPERYSHMYGPLAFMIPGWFLGLFGPGLSTSKIAGIAAAFAALIVMYRLARSVTTTTRALGLTAIFAVVCLIFRNLSFWIRPDSFLVLFSAVALLASTSRRNLTAVIGLGLATGVLWDLKITGVLYALPAFGIVVARYGLLAAVWASSISALTAALPFLIFPNVSLTNYLLWVHTSANNGLGFWTLRQNIEWALFLMLPVVPSLLASPSGKEDARVRAWMLGGLCLGVILVVLAASKPGAGPYHLLPFLPSILYAAACDLDRLPASITQQRAFRRGVLAFVSCAALVAFLQLTYFFREMTGLRGTAIAADIRQFMDAHPSATIEMGPGSPGEALTLFRPLLVFRNNSYFLDAPAVQEFQMSGLTLPPATIQALASCVVDYWLIPKSAEPFSSRNKYPSTGFRPLLSDEFRRTFANTYAHVGETTYFQVWSCRAGARK